MTMTQCCDLVAPGTGMAISQAPAVSEPMALFLADELLPLMAGLWPASAAQLNGNASGSAMAYGLILRGFRAKEIRDVVLGMGADVERLYAPRPGEIREVLMKGPEITVGTVSIAALEMISKVRQLRGDICDGVEALSADVAKAASLAMAKGFTVTERAL